MPTYSYACTECDNRFDAVQAFTDDALTTCPQCSGRLRKLFNSVGVVFKGSGFYRTDSRDSAGAKDGAPAASPTSEKSGAEKSGAEKSGGSEKKSSGDSGSGSSSSSSGASTSSSGASSSSSSAPAPASS
ncbi:MAG: FmdB family zinc ribbon protein [Mycobacteriaceae bacterium]